MAQFDNLAASHRGAERHRAALSPDHQRVRRRGEPLRLEAPRGAARLDAGDHAPRTCSPATRGSAAESLAGAALVRRLREKYEGRSRGSDLTPTEWMDDAPGSNALRARRLADDDGKADPPRQPASAVVVALLGGARPRAWQDRLLRFDAGRDPGSAGRLQRPARLRHHQQRARPGRRVRAEDGSAQPDHYLFDGESLPLRRRDVSIQVRTADGSMRTETRTFWSSHIGPVIYRSADRAFVVKSTRLDAFEYLAASTTSQGAESRRWMAALRRNSCRPRTSPTPTPTATSSTSGTAASRSATMAAITRSTSRRDSRRCLDALPFDRRLPAAAESAGRLRAERQQSAAVRLAARSDRHVRFPPQIERGPLGLRPQLALDLLERGRSTRCRT